jgi:hypothetical protein
MDRSFSTHGQQSAAKESSTTVSRSDTLLIQHLDSSAHGLLRRWLLIGYFPIQPYHPDVECLYAVGIMADGDVSEDDEEEVLVVQKTEKSSFDVRPFAPLLVASRGTVVEHSVKQQAVDSGCKTAAKPCELFSPDSERAR